MLTIYHSNRLDVLKDLLVALIAKNPPANPLADEQILVQSPGMAQWLRLQLAEGLSIAASINFPLPASFLWQMYVQVLPEVPKRSAFNKEAMTWKIMTLVNQLLDNESFAALRNYLADDQSHLKSYQLAGKIADIFDQYLVYRPDWILRWEAHDNISDITANHPWQPELWRALVKKTSDMGQSHWHRANMHEQFNQLMTEGTFKDKLPERLFVFGISALPPHFVESLQALGQQTDIHLMVTNPCRYFWGDIKDPKYLAKLKSRNFSLHIAGDITGQERQTSFIKSQPDSQETSNPLLASMGKLGRDYLYQIHEMEAGDIDAFVDINPGTLLQQIQEDILELIDSSSQDSKKPIPGTDCSIEIHSCHSGLREVEVLHDHLLDLFDHNPALSPKDIVVMLPDVDTYTPWIQAVFGSLDKHDRRYIPYSISDRSARNEHPVLLGILKLLELNNSRCSAPELLELLEIPALQRRFDIDQNGLETLRGWVHEVGVRWGLDQKQQQHFELPSMPVNTWAFGLRRMLLGYAMPEESGIHSHILPFDSVQGINASLSGQLADFIEHIQWLSETLDTERQVDEWIRYINQLLEQFFTPDETDEYALKSVRDALDHLHEQLQDADHREPLSKAILVSYLNERISNERSSQRFLAGKLNFCTLMPMRSIPFKVVCLLGMNDGAYPRSIAPAGFDLIAKHSRRGDRSRREDDRYLFLEALLSAQDRFYISYAGRSILDNSLRAPSVLVTELINYCEQGFEIAGKTLKDHLVREHSLQAFSPRSFPPENQDHNGKVFSYAREWLPAANHQGEKPAAFMGRPLQVVETANELELSELLRFYRNPCKHFCNTRLKVFFDQDEQVLEENEPFELDTLERYHLKQELLDTLIRGDNPNTVLKHQSARGALPYGAFGELLLDEQVKATTCIAAFLTPLLSTPKQDIDVTVTLAGMEISGWLSGHFKGGLIRYRPASIKARDILLGWIEHLCYCSMGQQGVTRIVGLQQKKEEYQQIIFENLSTKQAHQYLEKVITVYKEGLQHPLPLFTETAMAWLDQSDPDKAKDKARLCFEGNQYSKGSFAEGSDPYIARIYPSFEDSFSEMTTLAREVLFPALQHQVEGQ